MTGAADGAARVWGWQTGKLITTLAGHSGGVRDVRFAPSASGHVAVTAGDDGAVRVWSADTGALRAVYAPRATPVAPIRRIAVTADGLQVATASDDGHARLLPIDLGDIDQRLSSQYDAVSPW